MSDASAFISESWWQWSKELKSTNDPSHFCKRERVCLSVAGAYGKPSQRYKGYGARDGELLGRSFDHNVWFPPKTAV